MNPVLAARLIVSNWAFFQACKGEEFRTHSRNKRQSTALRPATNNLAHLDNKCSIILQIDEKNAYVLYTWNISERTQLKFSGEIW